MGESAPVSLTKSSFDYECLASLGDDSIGAMARPAPSLVAGERAVPVSGERGCGIVVHGAASIQCFQERPGRYTVSVNLRDSRMVVGGGPIGRAFQRALSREMSVSYKVIYDRYKQLHGFVLSGCIGEPGIVHTLESVGHMGRCMRQVGVVVLHAMVMDNDDFVVLHILGEARRPRHVCNVGMLYVAPDPRGSRSVANRKVLTCNPSWSGRLAPSCHTTGTGAVM